MSGYPPELVAEFERRLALINQRVDETVALYRKQRAEGATEMEAMAAHAGGIDDAEVPRDSLVSYVVAMTARLAEVESAK